LFTNQNICLKELNETAIWLRILKGSVAVDPSFVSRLVAENSELCRILVASVKTALANDSAKTMETKGKTTAGEN
jgi:four helix bundle protein